MAEGFRVTIKEQIDLIGSDFRKSFIPRRAQDELIQRGGKMSSFGEQGLLKDAFSEFRVINERLDEIDRVSGVIVEPEDLPKFKDQIWDIRESLTSLLVDSVKEGKCGLEVEK
ncbi:hypothetical protein KAR91_06900 [Candidatus Pacearchaeota archaeon]|nr:hypothetical protein [Candidatus Pacearchaeota archaeon]